MKKLNEFIINNWWDLLWDEDDNKCFIDGLSLNGKPDYFMYNGDKYFLVEYKTLTDFFRDNQVKWFYKNKKLPLLVIHSLEKSKKPSSNTKLQKKIIKENKRINKQNSHNRAKDEQK